MGTRNFLIALFALLFSILFLACQNRNSYNQSGTDSTLSNNKSSVSEDSDFLKEANQDDLLQIQLGQMAEQKAQSKDVRNFGKMMVRDHTQADSSLVQLAQSNNIHLNPNLNDDKKDEISDLAELSGKKFDEEYVDKMVDAHKDAVDNFKDEAQNASSPQVRQLASNTLPTLETHLNKIKLIQKNTNL